MHHHSMPWPAWFICLGSGAFAFQLHGQEAFRARLDPILSPGLVSGHTHAVFGGINFGSVVTTDSLAQSRCTTIENILDKSAYWTNPPYGRNANGTFSALRNVELSIYYRLSDGAPVNIFPENFRMIVGNASATSDVTTVANTEAYTSYQCQNYIPPHDVTGQWDFISGITAFPDVNCTELKIAITFPNCWNGEPDSSDHRSHVAYGSGPSCPTTHSKRIPQITFESIYYTDDYDIKDIFLATGDNTGYTIHADYAFGWENGGAELMAAMQDPTCQDSQEINPSLPPDFGDGICQTFTPYFNKTAAQACAADLTSQIPQEEVGIARPVPSLPGCNKPWSGSGLPDTKPTCNPAPETPQIGNPSRIFSWAESNANVPPVNIAIYDGFNQAPIPTTTPATSVKATATATASSVSGATPTGPASGTMYLTTGQNWDGTTANWSWKNGVCKTLTSPFLNDLGSAGPNSGTCTFYNQANCQGISLFTFNFPGMTGLGSKGDQAQSFKCI